MWIGDRVLIIGDVTIGNGAVIGAGSVITKDIPPYAIVVGNPARIIKYRFDENQIQKLLKIKWWNWDIHKIKHNKDWFNKDIDEFINKFYKEDDFADIKIEKKSKSILFIPDFEESYYFIWKNVIKEYIEKFTSNDDITLILRIESDFKFQEKFLAIQEILLPYKNESNIPDILILNDPIGDMRCVFKQVDYFITTRSNKTINFFDYCLEYGVKIISGVDIPMLDRNIL